MAAILRVRSPSHMRFFRSGCHRHGVCSVREISGTGLTPADVPLAVAIASAILPLPMGFVFGGWYVRKRIPPDSMNSRYRRWRALFMYSATVLSICFVIGISKPIFQTGSLIGWLISLSIIVAYGFYLLVLLSGLATVASFVAMLLTRSASA